MEDGIFLDYCFFGEASSFNFLKPFGLFNIVINDGPSAGAGDPGTMIWLEQKLFWVFGFKNFIMLIEMQKRVGFSKILRKNQKIYTFYVAVLT